MEFYKSAFFQKLIKILGFKEFYVELSLLNFKLYIYLMLNSSVRKRNRIDSNRDELKQTKK